MYWEQSNILIGKKKDYEFERYACFDLDDTLITTKSNKKFPVDGDDWKFKYPNVKDVLRSQYEKKYNIVIISNQRGLKTQVLIDEWKRKLNNIMKELDIPITVYASIVKDFYSKPYPTIYEKFITNATRIFYCGDAYDTKKAFSDTDLKFALNCGIKFVTPEKMFQCIDVIFDVPINPILNIKRTNELVNKAKQKEMIIMVGMMGSGKSYIAKKLGSNIVNRDTLGTMKKCDLTCERLAKLSEHIIIDNTNPTKESRSMFINIGKKYGYKIICIVMDTPIEISQHNMRYRHYKSNGNIELIPDIAYRIFLKKYEEPNYDEGIDVIEHKMISISDDVDEDYFLYFD